ncbi:MAG: hypothetical protein ABEK59_04495 [Halobacteria archaeon]
MTHKKYLNKIEKYSRKMTKMNYGTESDDQTDQEIRKYKMMP